MFCRTILVSVVKGIPEPPADLDVGIWGTFGQAVEERGRRISEEKLLRNGASARMCYWQRCQGTGEGNKTEDPGVVPSSSNSHDRQRRLPRYLTQVTESTPFPSGSSPQNNHEPLLM